MVISQLSVKLPFYPSEDIANSDFREVVHKLTGSVRLTSSEVCFRPPNAVRAALPPVFKCFKLTSDGENTYGFRMLNEIIAKLKYSKEENRKDLKWSSSPWWKKTNGKTRGGL
ncbi:hypothetical protein L2E82_21082 [Cichorium intybus]|uniref:Uncharacterized protein n=1 Tax=Cichorium intybus TaxID=13427 RepID=A0ACB9DW34_CICIN|nr:hypothetical protein L2E82_21082 [Cichorium intybus]